VYRCAFNGESNAPFFEFLKLPPVSGDTWNINTTTQGGARLVGAFKIKDVGADVTVPAGRYKAVVSGTDGMLINSKVPVSMTYWFASGIGMVKQAVVVSDKKTEIGLATYEPGK
jgi:hypothetical protein